MIDLSANVMYVIAYTLGYSNVPTYRIHELDLLDHHVVPSVVVTASHTLSNGRKYKFKAQFQRQRPGLLEANGNVYAGLAASAILRHRSRAAGFLAGRRGR